MWTCNKCGEKLEDNFDACWKCGTLKEGYLPADEEKSDKITNKVDSIKGSGASLIPWEKRKEIGLLKALWQTAMQVLFKPGKFFNNLIDRDDSSNAFSFYFSFSIVLIIIETIIGLPILVLTKNLPLRLLSSFLPFFIMAIIIIPIGIAIGIYTFSAIMHLFVLLFRGRGGFNGTFNIMAYSSPIIELVSVLSIIFSIASMIFGVFIPLPPIFRTVGAFLGPLILLIGLLWIVIVVVIGYKRIHRFGVIRASCAFLIPVIIVSSIQYAVNKREKEKAPQNLGESLKRLEQAKIKACEAQAKASIMIISVACQTYFTAKEEYPSSLRDLTNTAPPYMASELAGANSLSSAIEGYYYVYEFLDKEHFTLYARPTGADIPSGKVFFIDQSKVLRLDGPSGIPEEKAESLKWDLERLLSHDPRERAGAVLWLGERGDKEAVQPLIKALQDEYLEVKINAAEALGKIKDNSAVDPLIIALRDENENLRSAAARALGKIKDNQAVDSLIMTLSDKNNSVRLASIRALGNIGDTRAVEAIIDILKKGDKESREYAVRALGELKDNRAIDSLITALKDGEYDIRMYAKEALGEIGQDAIEPLISALNDENKDFRYMAGEALGKIGSTAVDPLIKTLKEGDVRSKAYAAYALGKTGSTNACGALIIALKNEDASVREFAAGALREIKDPSAVDALIIALNDQNDSVRCQVAYALADIKDIRVIDPLVNELKKEGDNFYIAYVLGSMGQPALGSLINALRGRQKQVPIKYLP